MGGMRLNGASPWDPVQWATSLLIARIGKLLPACHRPGIARVVQVLVLPTLSRCWVLRVASTAPHRGAITPSWGLVGLPPP